MLTLSLAMEMAERLVGCENRTVEEDALVILFMELTTRRTVARP